MKNRLVKLVLFFVLLLGFPSVTLAQEAKPITATASSEIVDVERTAVDLTAPSDRDSRLVAKLNEQKLKSWWGVDLLKIAIRKAVHEGVSPNTLVLLFLFPLVAGLVAFSRQVVGLSGFGIITPALLSVAFLSTGGLAGLVLLFFILGVATAGRMLIKKVKVPYLPKLAILIWVVSMSVLLLLLLSTGLGLERLTTVGFFPIMLFVLLAETFIEAQITRSFATSLWMTLETVVLAFVAYKIMSAPWVSTFVLLHPEVAVIAILVFDLMVGRYKGLRLLEIWRFRKLLDK